MPIDVTINDLGYFKYSESLKNIVFTISIINIFLKIICMVKTI